MHYIRISVTEQSFSNTNEVIQAIRSRVAGRDLTDLAVEKLTTVAKELNQSYFIEPTKRLGAKAATIRSVERAVNIAIGIEKKLLGQIFPRLSEENLQHIANMLELRMPHQDERGYYLVVPITNQLAELADTTIRKIRSNGKRQDCIRSIVDLGNDSLYAIIDYYFMVPLKDMHAHYLVVKGVDWASKLWIKMHALEVKRLCRGLSTAQLQIYADIIEEQVASLATAELQ